MLINGNIHEFIVVDAFLLLVFSNSAKTIEAKILIIYEYPVFQVTVYILILLLLSVLNNNNI